MNKERRSRIEEAALLLDQAREIVNEVKGKEEEAFENMPESLKGSERGERMEEICETLDSVLDSIDEAASSLDECRE